MPKISLSDFARRLEKAKGLVKDTIKGIPSAAFKIAKTVGKTIITGGLPSTESLRRAVGKMKELQKQKLPEEIYQKQMRKIIEEL